MVFRYFRRSTSGKSVTNSQKNLAAWKKCTKRVHRMHFTWWNVGPTWTQILQTKLVLSMLLPASKCWPDAPIQMSVNNIISYIFEFSSQIRKQWEHRDNMFNESVFVRQASRRKSWNWVFSFGEFAIHLSHSAVADVRIHDQFHTETETFARALHDEQCSRELYNITGGAENDIYIFNCNSFDTFGVTDTKLFNSFVCRLYRIRRHRKHCYA